MKCPNCGHEVSVKKRRGKPWPAAKKKEFQRVYHAAERSGASRTVCFKKAIQAVKGW